MVLVALLFPSGAPAGEPRPVVVATFTVIGDLLRQVAGEQADVRVLTPVGAEVHEWELSPRNFIDVEAAEIIFYNGLNLEQWVHQLEAAVARDARLVGLAEVSGYPTLPIVTGDFEGDPDPHLWMDPRAASAYVDVIEQALAEADPSRADHYRTNAEAFRAALGELHQELEEMLSRIPETHRILITSEAAFVYFAAAYGFFHDGIWGTNTEVEGTPRQMMRIMDLVNEHRPPAIFWESTISDRYVQGVARDAGVSVAGPLYVDSLGGPGSGAETYLEMMRRNAERLTEALATEGQ
jgi:manganese/iron transport system substrate-binding protein